MINTTVAEIDLKALLERHYFLSNLAKGKRNSTGNIKESRHKTNRDNLYKMKPDKGLPNDRVDINVNDNSLLKESLLRSSVSKFKDIFDRKVADSLKSTHIKNESAPIIRCMSLENGVNTFEKIDIDTQNIRRKFRDMKSRSFCMSDLDNGLVAKRQDSWEVFGSMEHINNIENSEVFGNIIEPVVSAQDCNKERDIREREKIELARNQLVVASPLQTFNVEENGKKIGDIKNRSVRTADVGAGLVSSRRGSLEVSEILEKTNKIVSKEEKGSKNNPLCSTHSSNDKDSKSNLIESADGKHVNGLTPDLNVEETKGRRKLGNMKSTSVGDADVSTGLVATRKDSWEVLDTDKKLNKSPKIGERENTNTLIRSSIPVCNKENDGRRRSMIDRTKSLLTAGPRHTYNADEKKDRRKLRDMKSRSFCAGDVSAGLVARRKDSWEVLDSVVRTNKIGSVKDNKNKPSSSTQSNNTDKPVESQLVSGPRQTYDVEEKKNRRALRDKKSRSFCVADVGAGLVGIKTESWEVFDTVDEVSKVESKSEMDLINKTLPSTNSSSNDKDDNRRSLIEPAESQLVSGPRHTHDVEEKKNRRALRDKKSRSFCVADVGVGLVGLRKYSLEVFDPVEEVSNVKRKNELGIINKSLPTTHTNKDKEDRGRRTLIESAKSQLVAGPRQTYNAEEKKNRREVRDRKSRSFCAADVGAGLVARRKEIFGKFEQNKSLDRKDESVRAESFSPPQVNNNDNDTGIKKLIEPVENHSISPPSCQVTLRAKRPHLNKERPKSFCYGTKADLNTFMGQRVNSLEDLARIASSPVIGRRDKKMRLPIKKKGKTLTVRDDTNPDTKSPPTTCSNGAITDELREHKSVNNDRINSKKNKEIICNNGNTQSCNKNMLNTIDGLDVKRNTLDSNFVRRQGDVTSSIPVRNSVTTNGQSDQKHAGTQYGIRKGKPMSDVAYKYSLRKTSNENCLNNTVIKDLEKPQSNDIKAEPFISENDTSFQEHSSSDSDLVRIAAIKALNKNIVRKKQPFKKKKKAVNNHIIPSCDTVSSIQSKDSSKILSNKADNSKCINVTTSMNSHLDSNSPRKDTSTILGGETSILGGETSILGGETSIVVTDYSTNEMTSQVKLRPRLKHLRDERPKSMDFSLGLSTLEQNMLKSSYLTNHLPGNIESNSELDLSRIASTEALNRNSKKRLTLKKKKKKIDSSNDNNSNVEESTGINNTQQVDSKLDKHANKFEDKNNLTLTKGNVIADSELIGVTKSSSNIVNSGVPTHLETNSICKGPSTITASETSIDVTDHSMIESKFQVKLRPKHLRSKHLREERPKSMDFSLGLKTVEQNLLKSSYLSKNIPETEHSSELDLSRIASTEALNTNIKKRLPLKKKKKKINSDDTNTSVRLSESTVMNNTHHDSKQSGDTILTSSNPLDGKNNVTIKDENITDNSKVNPVSTTPSITPPSIPDTNGTCINTSTIINGETSIVITDCSSNDENSKVKLRPKSKHLRDERPKSMDFSLGLNSTEQEFLKSSFLSKQLSDIESSSEMDLSRIASTEALNRNSKKRLTLKKKKKKTNSSDINKNADQDKDALCDSTSDTDSKLIESLILTNADSLEDKSVITVSNENYTNDNTTLHKADITFKNANSDDEIKSKKDTPKGAKCYSTINNIKNIQNNSHETINRTNGTQDDIKSKNTEKIECTKPCAEKNTSESKTKSKLDGTNTCDKKIDETRSARYNRTFGYNKPLENATNCDNKLDEQSNTNNNIEKDYVNVIQNGVNGERTTIESNDTKIDDKCDNEIKNGSVIQDDNKYDRRESTEKVTKSDTKCNATIINTDITHNDVKCNNKTDNTKVTQINDTSNNKRDDTKGIQYEIKCDIVLNNNVTQSDTNCDKTTINVKDTKADTGNNVPHNDKKSTTNGKKEVNGTITPNGNGLTSGRRISHRKHSVKDIQSFFDQQTSNGLPSVVRRKRENFFLPARPKSMDLSFLRQDKSLPYLSKIGKCRDDFKLTDL